MRISTFIFLLFFFSSCATIYHGTSAKVIIESSPPGATVAINGIECGKTPFMTQLSHSLLDETITLKKDGYESFNYSVEKRFRAATLLNIFTPGLGIFTVPVDLATGAFKASKPTGLIVKLEAKDPAIRAKENEVYYLQTKSRKIGYNPYGISTNPAVKSFHLNLPFIGGESAIVLNENNLDSILYIKATNNMFLGKRTLYATADTGNKVVKLPGKKLKSLTSLSYQSPKLSDLAKYPDLVGGYFGPAQESVRLKLVRKYDSYELIKKEVKSKKKIKSQVIYNQLIWPVDINKAVKKKDKTKPDPKPYYKVCSILAQNKNKKLALNVDLVSESTGGSNSIIYTRRILSLYYLNGDKVTYVNKKNYLKILPKFKNPYLEEIFANNKRLAGFLKDLNTDDNNIAKILIWTCNNVEKEIEKDEILVDETGIDTDDDTEDNKNQKEED